MSFFNGTSDHNTRHGVGTLANTAQLGVYRDFRQVTFLDLVRQSLGALQEHAIRYPRNATHPNAQPNTREHIGVVALSDPVALACELDGSERAAACYYCPTVGPENRLLGGALALARGIGERKYHWSVIEAGHGPDDRRSEHSRRA